VITSFPISTRAEIHTTPAIAKLCADVNGIEIVFGADDGYLYCLNYQNGALVLKWQFPSSPPALAPIRSSPVVGVLGEAGLPQVAFGCDNGTAYVLLGLDGSLQGSYNCGLGVKIRSTPVIANIDTVHNTGSPMGDLPELIFGADNGVLYAINFGVGASLVWSNQLGFVAAPVYSSPAAADIDHDPDLEILIGKNDGQLHVLKAQPVPASRPVADFAMNPASGARPLTVGFADRSSNSPNTWLWDFGDGATTAEQNPTHTYDAPGVYSVILTAANANGSRSKTNSITVLPAPLADFAAAPLFGFVPLTVQFTNLSLYGADALVWNFGNGTASSAQNPTNTYGIPGLYTVTLTASNAYGVDVAAKTNYITAAAVCPIANFSQSVNYGCAPLTVSFTDVSGNWPTSWAWDFGDGTTSTQQNPTHTYQTGGRYLVSLTASNSGGTDTKVGSSGVSVSTATVVSNFVPILNLPFEEGTGAIAHDATTNLSNGTIYGAQWVANDQSGYALYFHGGGQWFDGDAVTLPLSVTTTITNAFSVEARIKSGSSDHYLAIVDQLYSDWNLPTYGFSVYLTGGLLRLGVYSAGNGNGDCWGNTELRDNAWHVVKASWDGSHMRTYVDGNLQGECAWAYPPAYSTQSLGVGKRLSGWGGYMPFEGQIDYVIVSRLQTQEGPPAGPDIARWGDQIMIYWDSCGVLQSADEITDQWTDVPGATNPYFTTPNASRMFYRLRAR
jgi:PKD repeat protein